MWDKLFAEAETWTTLTKLDLSSSGLSGPIPLEIGKLVNLTELDLSGNNLSGPIPPEIGKLTNLKRLYLHKNQLSGTIPPKIGKLANLKRLRLGGNQLSGSLPLDLMSLAQLNELRFEQSPGAVNALCAPQDGAFQAWLQSLNNVRGPNCDPSAAVEEAELPTQSLPTVGDIAAALEAWADPGFAESYDNVGLHVGDAGRSVQRGLIALDLTPDVVTEAVRCRASIVITHHPLLFHPLRSITADDLTGSMALHLAEAGIALYSAHTNLDAVAGGVSFSLAARLGIAAPRFLRPNPDGISGLGAIGSLAEALTLRDFLHQVAEQLQAPALRFAGHDAQLVRTVAVCGGAGASLTAQALAAGAEVFVTSDISYHRFFEVMRPDGTYAMSLVDAGHYETEQHTEALLCSALQKRFPAAQWVRTSKRTSPIRVFAA